MADGVFASSAAELAAGERFAFGANWSRFLSVLDDTRIAAAEMSLQAMLDMEDLQGKRFLDAGSGSGLFSLAARRLGASVHSFDYDARSVACTAELKRRYFPNDAQWRVEAGSVLDSDYLNQLGEFDVVYSWGVLHHTGQMWQAMQNVSALVRRPNGRLFIAIYNDQGRVSRYWYSVKKAYVKFPLLRWLLVLAHLPYPFLPSLARRLISGQHIERGMSFWHDIVDWVGGFPFEVATPAAVVEFYADRGFQLTNARTTSRSGCNEFVFVKER